jgi:hypothetical protein
MGLIDRNRASNLHAAESIIAIVRTLISCKRTFKGENEREY